jgi:hypothetical protein
VHGRRGAPPPPPSDCRLDFLKPTGPTQLFEPELGDDGNIVMELYLLERASTETIEQNSLDPYTCLVHEYPGVPVACLDVASITTLSGTINSSYVAVQPDDLPTAVLHAGVGASTTSTGYFGNSQLCDDGKRIGDGILDGLDVYVVLAHRFAVPPYDQLSADASAVPTVQGETDLGSRCGDGVSRTQYYEQFEPAQPCTRPGGRRRLAEAPRPMRSAVYRHRVVGAGAWYLVRLDALTLSLQVTLRGVANVDYVGLSNALAPWRADIDATPHDAARHELRYARHAEYGGGVDPSVCAPIVSTLTGDAAMYRDVVALGQFPDAGRRFYCKYDLYLYVPDDAARGRRASEGCAVAVAAGSRGIDGASGVWQEETSACVDAPYSFVSPPSSPLPPPSSPLPPPSSPPPSSPPSSPSSPAGFVAALVVASLVLCVCTGTCVYLRRTARTPHHLAAARPVGHGAARGAELSARTARLRL